MNRRWFLGGLAALLVAGVSAEARMHYPYRGHRIVPANAAPPLDSITAAYAAYSWRKLRTAYAGPAVKLQRVDTTTADIGFVGSDFDVGTAAAFCTTTCSVNTWYDQSGNGRPLANATIAAQPVYVPNCNGTKPCLELTLSTQILQSASFTPATGTASINVVANRAVGTGVCVFFRQDAAGGNRVAGNAANLWALSAAAGGITSAATDSGWHTGAALFNGASSSLAVDGNAATSGSITNATAAGPMAVVGAASTTCRESEVILWDNYLLSPGEAAALVANQRSYGLIP